MLVMKKSLLLFIGVAGMLCFKPVKAQLNSESTVIYCDEFHVTRPLRDLAKEGMEDIKRIEEARRKKFESPDRKHRTAAIPEHTLEDGAEYATDEKFIQKDNGSRDNRAPLVNWAGLTASGFRPFDPSGAAGPNHYIQAINATTYRVYNKANGGNMATGLIGSLWSPSTPNDGDPIIMYDRFADRWFISQFGTSGNRMYIAISTTADPLGSYYTYTFTSPQFPDYLKFSIWSNGYYMTANTSTQRVFAFERDAMLAGSATARAVSATFNPPRPGGFFCPLPGDADGNGGLPAASAPCPIFSFSDNGWGGSNIDAIQIYHATVNWVPATPTLTITNAGPVATAAFDGSYNSGWNDISQPGTSQKLDGIGGVLNYRAQWRKWSGYNSVVLTWGVRISASQRSIMWCELRQNQGTGVWSMYQQGVFTPDAASRWNGSISMDDNGNIALAYAKSDASTIKPSLCYTGRLSTDPLGQMTFAEETAIAGLAVQTSGNRYGDYSHTSLDPDGVTFWHTGEWMGGTNGATTAARTRIYSFQLQASTQAVVAITSNDADNAVCIGTNVTFTAAPTNGGTTPTYQWLVNGNPVGTNSPTFSSSTLSTGDVVTCVMTSNMPGVTGNPATSNSVTMTVSPVPTTPSPVANTPVCTNGTLNLTTGAVTGATYAWTGPSGYVSNTQNPNRPNVTSGMAGTYSLTVTVGGCSSAAGSVTVTVNPSPSAPGASTNSPVCSGNTIQLNASTVANATYAWTGPNGFTSTTQNPTITGSTTANTGSYSVVAIGTNGCSSTASSASVIVNATPATPTITQNGGILTSSSSSGNQWYLNGSPISGATGQNYTPTTNGIYTVVVTLSGCSSTASSQLNVTNVGIDEENLNMLMVFPNPTNGKFSITFESVSGKEYVLEIFNDIGQVVFSETFRNGGSIVRPIDLGENASGIYTVTLKSEGKSTIKKVVVQR